MSLELGQDALVNRSLELVQDALDERAAGRFASTDEGSLADGTDAEAPALKHAAADLPGVVRGSSHKLHTGAQSDTTEGDSQSIYNMHTHLFCFPALCIHPGAPRGHRSASPRTQ